MIPSSISSLASNLIALTKPRITLVVLATTGAGLFLAPGALPSHQLLLAIVGTVLVVAAANVLNMWWERDVDALMKRTQNRPLPAGRIPPALALGFGLLLGLIAVPLLFHVNRLTGFLGLFALISYVAIYTPLKRRTLYALQIGAIPGAIPPLLGWTSVTGTIEGGGLALFGLLFFWQLPHFMAISLFRKQDYARAGLRVYGAVCSQQETHRAILFYSLLLVGISVAPFYLHLARGFYLISAILLGVALLGFEVRGFRSIRSEEAERWARSLFGFSIIYLILLLCALLLDHACVS
ncbi:heme o synthase [Pajaroellobacter abortibovis]|uniref:Protoheme IX farnesyltransferase n=1 Tax=Pajaroellobacter abortibovis TaxID=1882918 RepID=A0A1L6MZ31_9BACT|nr:heme o synthase [Pajaroellobacter abortibovis]APS00851.1 protoheme IX farnesyltransferase [Pajaroellobacter abortibovis]